VVPSRFPIPIDVPAARVRFAELRGELGDEDSGDGEAILEGLLRIADERMAEAIRISVRKGIDPQVVCRLGGAGGQHAAGSRVAGHGGGYPACDAGLSARWGSVMP
jgi:N-methylhydantoinase A/oxoprolinase/acetone carboxylase beta subunit